MRGVVALVAEALGNAVLCLLFINFVVLELAEFVLLVGSAFHLSLSPVNCGLCLERSRVDLEASLDHSEPWVSFRISDCLCPLLACIVLFYGRWLVAHLRHHRHSIGAHHSHLLHSVGHLRDHRHLWSHSHLCHIVGCCDLCGRGGRSFLFS